MIKIKEITKHNMWHPKSMMPFGKVTIVKRKSLLVSKINHVMLFLPAPKIETIFKLDTMLKSYTWSN